MFSQLFFIFLVFTLINFIPETSLEFWVKQPNQAFQLGMFIYFSLLILLYCQSRYVGHLLKKNLQSLWWFFINLELLVFLGLYHFGFGSQRFFLQGIFNLYQTPFILFSLLLYFGALGWSHLWYAYFHLHFVFKKALSFAYQQILFYYPFCLSFITISFFLDGLQYFLVYQNEALPISVEFIAFLFSLFFLGLIFIFFPFVIVVCWRCQSLNYFDLNKRLEKVCGTLHFRHAGFKIWSIMPHSFTAGIIGVFPAFRYILFTPPLLNQFSQEEIEAILIHEIGHNRYRHLLFYPFILLGMLVSSILLLVGIEHLLILKIRFIVEEHQFILSMGIFTLYALLMGLYFRLVFGFFSRLFERQADLYIFESPSSPIFLIQALDHLGIVTGYTHSQPSWHHFSLQERIRFLYQAIENPHTIFLHHQRVKRWLVFYFFTLLISCLFLYWVIFIHVEYI